MRPAIARASGRAVALFVFVASGVVWAGDKSLAPSKLSESSIAVKASTEVSGYADTDSVSVASPSIAGRVTDVLAGWSVGGHYLVDFVSAASVDIVSTASRKWNEVRHAGSADASYKTGSVTLGGSGVFSSEPDYLSLAGGGTLTVDLFDKNVTPFVGFSYATDQVGRTGLPTEFWKNKETISAQAGFTFVVDRSTLASLQADGIQETGYLAKPYRYVPLFAPGQGASIPVGAPISLVNALRLDARPAEQLPSARHRVAATLRIAHRFEGSTLRLDERGYTDSWGLWASTSDLRWIVDLSRRVELWPHLRFHYQTEVAFWQRAYEATIGTGGAIGVPVIRTGDRELGPLRAGTAGLGTRIRLIDDLKQPWWLLFEIDGSYTRYLDSLYIRERGAAFSTLAIETEF